MIDEFDDASRPPIAKRPSEVKNHLYLSYHSLFFCTEKTTESFAISACFLNPSKILSVFLFSNSIVSIAFNCLFDSLNKVDAIAGMDESGFIFIFSSLTIKNEIPLSFAIQVFCSLNIGK